MYSANLQKSNTKHLVFWVVPNSQNCKYEVVNGIEFETSNILSRFVIFL
jgi:hypothetical protein